jgi:hypothetical protein
VGSYGSDGRATRVALVIQMETAMIAPWVVAGAFLHWIALQNRRGSFRSLPQCCSATAAKPMPGSARHPAISTRWTAASPAACGPTSAPERPSVARRRRCAAGSLKKVGWLHPGASMESPAGQPVAKLPHQPLTPSRVEDLRQAGAQQLFRRDRRAAAVRVALGQHFGQLGQLEIKVAGSTMREIV